MQCERTRITRINRLKRFFPQPFTDAPERQARHREAAEERGHAEELTGGRSLAEQESRLRERAGLLEKTFTDFGLNVRVVGINTGPVITQYEVALETGLRRLTAGTPAP